MNIFISYRRHDSAGEAGRLVDSLKQYFKEEEIFIDIDTIQPGLDFSDVIESSLNTCDVLLALIGPNWLALQSPDGARRLDNPDDFIRLEIAEALKRKIRVIPVLVDGATLPEGTQLPEDLRGLVRRQAYEISNKRWKFDVDELVKSLKKNQPSPTPVPDPTPPAPTPPRPPFPQNPVSPASSQIPPPPKNWLIESIATTLLCCLPLGIVGIINAAKVDGMYKAGDYAGAQKASQVAAKWTKIAFFTGIGVYIIYFILYAIGTNSAPTSY